VAESDGKPVLIAYDGSDHAKEAIRQAGRELHTPREASVVSVYEPLGAIPFWGVPAARVPDEWVTEVRQEAAKTAAEGAELATAAGFEATPAVMEEVRTWQGILTAAKDADAGLIVLGSHGRGSVGSALLGSVATAVAHHAKLPVLICRPANSR
jgi:nucleotide-binding universal stress UspA family protein